MGSAIPLRQTRANNVMPHALGPLFQELQDAGQLNYISLIEQSDRSASCLAPLVSFFAFITGP